MSSPLLDEIRQALLDYDGEKVRELAARAIDGGVDPLETIAVLTETISEIGDRFGAGELWLPELVGAAKAMGGGMELLQARIAAMGQDVETRGRVVLGTVFGDVHSIGMDMVATLLVAGGFTVRNLGVNVSADQFIAAIKEEDADILGMSALLTTTAPEQRRVISRLDDEGLRDRVQVLVGGGPVTPEFADEIGADGYAPNAMTAVDVAVSLLTHKEAI